jgi:hypothetical protein
MEHFLVFGQPTVITGVRLWTAGWQHRNHNKGRNHHDSGIQQRNGLCTRAAMKHIDQHAKP